MTKNSSISESFSGGSTKVGDMSQVKLGPSGVGGKEIWDFASEADALIATITEVFG